MEMIYKLELTIADRATLFMPPSAVVLKVAYQNGVPCLWFKKDISDMMSVVRYIRIIGTGHPIQELQDRSLKYLDSLIDEQNGFVWHVFEDIFANETI